VRPIKLGVNLGYWGAQPVDPVPMALVGPRDRIRDQLALWGEAGVDTIIVGTSGPEPLRALAEAAS
jgi:hypothetical protein